MLKKVGTKSERKKGDEHKCWVEIIRLGPCIFKKYFLKIQ